MRTDLYNKISSFLNKDASTFRSKDLVKILLFGKEDVPNTTNKNILEEVASFISRTKRFDSNRASPVGRVGGVT